MEESPTAEIQEEANVNENSGSRREANSPSGNAVQNREVDREANSLEGVLANITEMLKKLEPPLSLECCIYRVPRDLRKLNEEAYTPKVISIGPFHHGVETLEAMENYKVRYFKIFVEKAELSMENLVSTIRDMEEDVRCCYSESSGLSSNDYVKMILLDASFIIVFLLSWSHVEWSNCDDRTTFTQRLMSIVFGDLWLLENQLPLFVIEKLYDLAFASRKKYQSFIELTFQLFEEVVRPFFQPQNKHDMPPSEEVVRSYLQRENEHHMSPSPNLKTRHFVDLVRKLSLLQSQRLQARNLGNLVINLYCASQLDEAGVKFKVSSSKCLFDLKFSNGVLEIPRLTLYANTESLFRNLVALEQCHYQPDHYVTDYIRVLDFLIDTDKDVDLLVEKGILVNTLGDSNAVISMVNKLSQQTCFLEMNSDYCRLCEDLNSFYEVPCHSWMAILRRDYFSTPWRIASTVAAFILLVLTFIQTVRSFY